jgi:hypothetical protein
MNHGVYAPFFLQPTDTRQRQYEVLRSVIVERQPLPAVADRFGISHGTVRNWVSAFRAQYDRGRPPPFSPRHRGDGLRAGTAGNRLIERRSKLRTSQACPWSPAVACPRGPRECSCFGPCSRGCGSTAW